MMTFRFLNLDLFRFLTITVADKSNCLQDQALANDAWYEKLNQMAARAKQRRQLSRLSDEQLDDIGVTRAQVIEEVNKPFWKA